MAITYTSAAAILDVRGASYDELKARFRALASVVDAVGAERQALHIEIQGREMSAAALARTSQLSRDGKRALKEIVNSAEFAK